MSTGKAILGTKRKNGIPFPIRSDTSHARNHLRASCVLPPSVQPRTQCSQSDIELPAPNRTDARLSLNLQRFITQALWPEECTSTRRPERRLFECSALPNPIHDRPTCNRIEEHDEASSSCSGGSGDCGPPRDGGRSHLRAQPFCQRTRGADGEYRFRPYSRHARLRLAGPYLRPGQIQLGIG